MTINYNFNSMYICFNIIDCLSNCSVSLTFSIHITKRTFILLNPSILPVDPSVFSPFDPSVTRGFAARATSP